MKKRGQTSIEFLIFIGIASLMFLTFLIIAVSYLQGITKNKELTEAEDISKILRNEINLAAWVKGNYERTVHLPDKLNGLPYFIRITNRELLIKSDNIEFSQKLSTQVDNDISTEAIEEIILISFNMEYVIKKENDKITMFEK